MSLSAMTEASKPPLKDRLIPWYFVAAFLVVFAVNGVFVSLAIRSNLGVVTEQAYEKGLAYDATLAAARKQDALGWSGSIRFQESQLQLHLLDAKDTFVSCSHVTAHLERPLEKGYDMQIMLTDTKAGFYAAPIEFPKSGQWQITVVSQCNQHEFQMRTRLVIP